jgi:alpha-beta hydrolase superfamily lysophospholipase
MLVLHGGSDRLMPHRRQRNRYARTPTRQISPSRSTRLHHETHNEPEQDTVLAGIVACDRRP